MPAGKLIIGTKIDDKGFSGGLKKLNNDANTSAGKLSSVFKKIAGAAAAAFTVDRIVSFGKECVEAASQAQQSQTKLTEVMKAMMGATSGQVGQVNKLIDAESKTGVIGKTAQRNGAQQLATYIHSTSALKTLIPAMNDLAVQQKGTSATSEDLVNISNMMGKVFTGQVGALRRAGISFDENSEKILKNGTEEEKAAELAKVVTQNVGNMNQVMAKTPSGQIAQAKNRMAELKTEIGESLLPVVAAAASKGAEIATTVLPPIVSGLKTTMSFLQQHQAILPGIAIAIGIVTTAMTIQAAAQAVKSAINKTEEGTLLGLIKAKMADAAASMAALAPYLLIAAAIAAVIVVAVLLVKHWDQVKAAAISLKNTVVGAFKSAVNTVKSAFAVVVNFFKQQLEAERQRWLAFIGVFKIIGGAFASFGRTLLGAARNAGNAIKDGFSTGVNYIKNLPKNFLKWGREMIQHLIDGIKSKIDDAGKAAKSVGDKIKSFLHFSIPDEGPLTDIDTWMPDMMTLLADGITDNLDTIGTASQAIGQTIKDNVDDTPIKAPTVTNDLSVQAVSPEAMQSALKSTYSAMPDKASVATQQAQTDIIGSMAAQVKTVQSTAPTMQTAAQQAFNPIVTTATGQTNQARTTVQTNMQKTASFITSCLGLFQSSSYKIFNTIATSATNRTTAAKSTVQTNTQATAALIAASVGQFQSSSYKTFNAIVTSATNRTTAAKSSTQTIITALEVWIRGQQGQFYSLGVYTMQGYNNGLRAEKATVVGTTNDLVKAVKNAFVKGLGIHSPAHVTYEYGRYTGLGFINGLNSTELGKFTRSTVNDMKGAFKHNKFTAEANVNYLDDDTPREVTWMRKYDGGSVVKGADGGKGNRFISTMLGLVNDDSHGYSQANRWGPDYDCSSSIIYSLKKAGFDTGSASTTHNLSSNLTARGWQRLPYKDPKRGDILLNDAKHVEMSLGDGNNAGFHSAHGHPEPGDQAHEAYVGRDPGGWAAILRWKGGFGDSLADAIEEAYNFKKYGFGDLDASGDASVVVGGKLGDWVKAALEATGQPMSLAGGLVKAAKAESGGNPKAVNNRDINARLGHPSKGLMQTIDSTFKHYKMKGHDNIWNPVDNLIASIRYMIARYGSVQNVLKPRAKHWHGYAVGSRFISRDQFAQIHAGEAVIRKSENPYANSKGGFMTTALQEGVNAVMADFANKVAVTAGTGGETVVTNNNDMTQNVYFQETPKKPSEFRAELRQAGRSLAFNGN